MGPSRSYFLELFFNLEREAPTSTGKNAQECGDRRMNCTPLFPKAAPPDISLFQLPNPLLQELPLGLLLGQRQRLLIRRPGLSGPAGGTGDRRTLTSLHSSKIWGRFRLSPNPLGFGMVSAKNPTLQLRSGQAFSQRTREMGHPAPSGKFSGFAPSQ